MMSKPPRIHAPSTQDTSNLLGKMKRPRVVRAHAYCAKVAEPGEKRNRGKMGVPFAPPDCSDQRRTKTDLQPRHPQSMHGRICNGEPYQRCQVRLFASTPHPIPVSLVRIAEELAREHNFLVTICKVPSNDGRILTTANNSSGVELQLKHSRVGAVGIERSGERVRRMVMMMVVVVWSNVGCWRRCRSLLCGCSLRWLPMSCVLSCG